jgi:hypothetical protein
MDYLFINKIRPATPNAIHFFAENTGIRGMCTTPCTINLMVSAISGSLQTSPPGIRKIKMPPQIIAQHSFLLLFVASRGPRIKAVNSAVHRVYMLCSLSLAFVSFAS